MNERYVLFRSAAAFVQGSHFSLVFHPLFKKLDLLATSNGKMNICLHTALKLKASRSEPCIANNFVCLQ